MSSEDEAESEEIKEMSKNLCEKFDAVVILCSRHDGVEGTRTISRGSGNWHTRLGLAREYVIHTEEEIRGEARS